MADDADSKAVVASYAGEEELQMEDPCPMVTLRTNAKRRHTGAVNRIRRLFKTKS